MSLNKILKTNAEILFGKETPAVIKTLVAFNEEEQINTYGIHRLFQAMSNPTTVLISKLKRTSQGKTLIRNCLNLTKATDITSMMKYVGKIVDQEIYKEFSGENLTGEVSAGWPYFGQFYGKCRFEEKPEPDRYSMLFHTRKVFVSNEGELNISDPFTHEFASSLITCGVTGIWVAKRSLSGVTTIRIYGNTTALWAMENCLKEMDKEADIEPMIPFVVKAGGTTTYACDFNPKKPETYYTELQYSLHNDLERLEKSKGEIIDFLKSKHIPQDWNVEIVNRVGYLKGWFIRALPKENWDLYKKGLLESHYTVSLGLELGAGNDQQMHRCNDRKLLMVQQNNSGLHRARNNWHQKTALENLRKKNEKIRECDTTGHYSFEDLVNQGKEVLADVLNVDVKSIVKFKVDINPDNLDRCVMFILEDGQNKWGEDYIVFHSDSAQELATRLNVPAGVWAFCEHPWEDYVSLDLIDRDTVEYEPTLRAFYLDPPHVCED